MGEPCSDIVKYPLCVQRGELLCMLMFCQNTDAQSTPNQQAVPRALAAVQRYRACVAISLPSAVQ
eukprot:10574367-Alexandrium_andersonii.AAC.1